METIYDIFNFNLKSFPDSSFTFIGKSKNISNITVNTYERKFSSPILGLFDSLTINCIGNNGKNFIFEKNSLSEMYSYTLESLINHIYSIYGPDNKDSHEYTNDDWLNYKNNTLSKTWDNNIYFESISIDNYAGQLSMTLFTNLPNLINDKEDFNWEKYETWDEETEKDNIINQIIDIGVNSITDPKMNIAERFDMLSKTLDLIEKVDNNIKHRTRIINIIYLKSYEKMLLDFTYLSERLKEELYMGYESLKKNILSGEDFEYPIEYIISFPDKYKNYLQESLDKINEEFKRRLDSGEITEEEYLDSISQ